MSFIIDPYRFERTDMIQNGDFSNVSGMGVTGGGWYNNTPPSWFSQSPHRNSGYSVLLLEGKYYANLNTLSSSAAAQNAFQPLLQNIVFSSSESNLTATWTIRSLNGSPYSMSAAFYEEENFAAPFAVYNSPFDANTRTVSLVSGAIPPYIGISFAMWQSAGTAPGITDLTIYKN